jgi:hypothetical protein
MFLAILQIMTVHYVVMILTEVISVNLQYKCFTVAAVAKTGGSHIISDLPFQLRSDNMTL